MWIGKNVIFKKLKKEINKSWIPFKLMLKVTQAKLQKLEPSRINPSIIISLTSYPKRFPTLHLTLKSLLMQTVLPEKIVLWIAEEDKNKLPNKVTELQSQGFIDIRMTHDTRSYKKIIPSLMAFPHQSIITVDDDVYYPPTSIETLVQEHQKHPNTVIANRTHIIETDANNKIAPYKDWAKNSASIDNPEYNFQTGVGGVLYPPGILHDEVTNEPLFVKLAPHADDVWLYWMMRKNNHVAIKTDNDFKFHQWLGSQKTALYKSNVRQNGNDEQIKQMFEYFGSPF